MEKTGSPRGGGPALQPKRRSWHFRAACLIGLICLAGLYHIPSRHHCAHRHIIHRTDHLKPNDPFDLLPNSPFHFIPCTNATLPPALDDPNPKRSWSKLFDPNPEHWSWGNKTAERESYSDPYAGRGIYLCGWLDVPLDYTNKSDPRIARLAVTKFQVSGLARIDGASSSSSAGQKSERTLVIEPGGPGGSGTSMAWRSSESVTQRLSDGQFDVLGWDPRGVNASLPALSCYPFDADRDRWSLVTGQYREVTSPRAQLDLADTMNQATFRACLSIHGDLPRFVGTAFVARDLEQIRLALGEEELTGYFVSYGTGIAQTYTSLFPQAVGRMILDGCEYVRDHRLLAGFGTTALDNATDAWHDGFLGECVKAGPDHCALAKPTDGHAVTLDSLEARMEKLVKSLIERPLPGYTSFGGPSLITYSALVGAIYGALYNAFSWPAMAHLLHDLEAGNTTLAATMLEHKWEYGPNLPAIPNRKPSSDELGSLVICADSYDAPLPDGLDWWESLWANMTEKSWISGNSRFYNVLPCQRFTEYWPEPAEVYRGDLNKTLQNPVLLIAETYDPATPLRNGRRLLEEMGENARLIAHHGYGHSSRDKSSCTDAIAKAFILGGMLPEEQETACFADEKPYLYGVAKDAAVAWREHLIELAILNPRLV